MKRALKRLGHFELQFFAYVQTMQIERVYKGSLQEALGVSSVQENKLLSRMSQSGLISRLKRGVYLVPPRLPPGGRWRPSEYALIRETMNLFGADYYVSGPAAFSYYGLETQIPNVMTIYNDKISSKRNIGGQDLEFIRTATDRIAGWQEIDLTDEGEGVRIATFSRAIIDAIYDWKRFNTIPKAYRWVEAMIENQRELGNLVSLAIKVANVATRRRMGFLLETLGVDQKWVKSLSRTLNEASGWIPFYPGVPMRGKTNSKWRIIDNREEGIST